MNRPRYLAFLFYINDRLVDRTDPCGYTAGTFFSFEQDGNGVTLLKDDAERGIPFAYLTDDGKQLCVLNPDRVVESSTEEEVNVTTNGVTVRVVLNPHVYDLDPWEVDPRNPHRVTNDRNIGTRAPTPLTPAPIRFDTN